MIIDIGLYEMKKLSETIINDVVEAENLGEGNFPKNISDNENTFKTQVDLKTSYRIDFTKNSSFRNFLGFEGVILSSKKFISNSKMDITEINRIPML